MGGVWLRNGWCVAEEWVVCGWGVGGVWLRNGWCVAGEWVVCG